MPDIKLLSAPVILPPLPEAGSAPTSLSLASHFTAADLAKTRSDTAYPNDNFVWTVSAGDDGSFHFYAVPLRGSLNGGDSLSAQVFAPNCNALNASNAVAQYRLASMPMPMCEHLLNVYA